MMLRIPTQESRHRKGIDEESHEIKPFPVQVLFLLYNPPAFHVRTRYKNNEFILKAALSMWEALGKTIKTRAIPLQKKDE